MECNIEPTGPDDGSTLSLFLPRLHNPLGCVFVTKLRSWAKSVRPDSIQVSELGIRGTLTDYIDVLRVSIV